MSAICSEPPIESVDRTCFPLDWNGPVDRQFDAFPDDAKSRPIVELLEEIVRRYPERVAVLDAESSLTYAELWMKIGGWAARLANATSPGDLVGIVAPTATNSAVAMLACFAAGRPFVAIDPHAPQEWIAQAVGRTNAALLLVSDVIGNVVASFSETARVFDLSDTPPLSANWRTTPLAPDAPACVLFTSGSTGVPKGIVNSQRNLLQRVGQSINAAHINCNDRFLTLASVNTIVGVRDVLTAVLAGASIFLLDPHKSSATDILRVIDRQKISILFSFPALLRTLVRSSRDRAGVDLRLVRVGGDTTLWSDITLLRAWLPEYAFIQSIYAATEAPMMQWFVEGAGEGKLPIGYPLPGNELIVIDDDGDPAPEGEIGELVVRSAYVALGEWADGLRKANEIDVDPLDASIRTLKTGDLARRRSDGFLDRIGRKDRQVKVRGVRVELEGVETAIRRHRSVRDVGVLARTEDDDTLQLIAYVESRDNNSAELFRELRTMLNQSVPSPMQPWRYYAIGNIPRLSNSKLDVHALRAIDAAKRREEQTQPPVAMERTPMLLDIPTNGGSANDAVARAWCDVLGVARVTRDDDFFDLGGDSLRAIKLTAELERTLERRIPLTLINEAPKFGEYCAALDVERHTRYSPLVTIKAGDDSTPLFMIHGAGGSVMELFTLGRSLLWPGAVIGIQARGLNENEAPHRTVEAMAEEYLRAIRSRQPKGPYLLCGYSFGGLAAFEIARRLIAVNEPVAFLGMLDTLPPGNHVLRAWTWLAYLQRDLRQRVFARNGVSLIGWANNAALVRARAVALSALRASTAYRPSEYSGEVTFFEPGRRELGLPSLSPRWRRYAAALRWHTLQSRHLEMLTGCHAQATADLIGACLRQSIGHSGASRENTPGSCDRPVATA